MYGVTHWILNLMPHFNTWLPSMMTEAFGCILQTSWPSLSRASSVQITAVQPPAGHTGSRWPHNHRGSSRSETAAKTSSLRFHFKYSLKHTSDGITARDSMDIGAGQPFHGCGYFGVCLVCIYKTREAQPRFNLYLPNCSWGRGKRLISLFWKGHKLLLE